SRSSSIGAGPDSLSAFGAQPDNTSHATAFHGPIPMQPLQIPEDIRAPSDPPRHSMTADPLFLQRGCALFPTARGAVAPRASERPHVRVPARLRDPHRPSRIAPHPPAAKRRAPPR